MCDGELWQGVTVNRLLESVRCAVLSLPLPRGNFVGSQIPPVVTLSGKVVSSLK